MSAPGPMSTHTPPPPARETLPRGLHDAIVEMAIATHKRSIYPAGHPILQGAAESLHGHVTALLQDQSELALGIADRRLVVNGVASDNDHPLLSEFAARLAAHQVGAMRIAPGVTLEELDQLLGEIARPADGEGQALGPRDGSGSAHVTIHPVAFERLGLLAGSTSGPDAGAADATWRALAAAAMRGDGVGGDATDPRALAAAISAGGPDADFDEVVVDRLSEMLDELAVTGSALSPGARERLSDLIARLGETTLARLFDAGGAERGTRVVRSANDVLGTSAVVELARAASSTNAVSISGAMLRLLQKLSARANVAGARGGEVERVLRAAIRRLLDGWTLENPNPEMYERVLENVAATAGRRTADRRVDVVEPERLVDLAIETQHVGEAAEVSLGRLVVRDGIASVLERLHLYPPNAARESLIDRLLNEAALRESLAQDVLDLPVLRQAVDRMKRRAVAPLLAALERRAGGDSGALVELLARVGWDALEPLGAALAGAHPRLLRDLVGVFERLDAWPPQADPAQYAGHADFVVRREAIRYLLQHDASRAKGVDAALRDPDTRILNMGLLALVGDCPLPAARLAMARYADSYLGTDVRIRVIRAVGSCRHPEVLAWLESIVITRRWLLRTLRLRKPSPETLAAVAALVAGFGETEQGGLVTRLASASGSAEYRRAVARGSRAQGA